MTTHTIETLPTDDTPATFEPLEGHVRVPNIELTAITVALDLSVYAREMPGDADPTFDVNFIVDEDILTDLKQAILNDPKAHEQILTAIRAAFNRAR